MSRSAKTTALTLHNNLDGLLQIHPQEERFPEAVDVAAD